MNSSCKISLCVSDSRITLVWRSLFRLPTVPSKKITLVLGRLSASELWSPWVSDSLPLLKVAHSSSSSRSGSLLVALLKLTRFGLQTVDGASSVVFSSGFERTLEFLLWFAGQAITIGWFEKDGKKDKDITKPKNKRMTKINPLLGFSQLLGQKKLTTFPNMK